MDETISLKAKKDFVRWFLKRYKLKRRECVWILNYLLSHEQLLQNVHFTDEAHYCPRAMVMSTTGSESIPFRFYKGNLMTADAEKAFHSLRLYPEEKMYVQLNFPNNLQCLEYLAVLSDIEFRQSNEEGLVTVSEDIERLVSVITASTNRVSLMNEIDKSLDSGDKGLFMQLSGMLNEQEGLKEISFSA